VKWFRFLCPFGEEILEIAATPSKGRVSFYISTNPNNMHPTSSDYDYVSWGTPYARFNLNTKPGLWIYVGVEAFGDSIYTFNMHTIHTLTQLTINKNINVHVQVQTIEQSKYFFALVPKDVKEPLIVGVTYFTGKYEIYVSTEKNSAPSPDNYDWKSVDGKTFSIPDQNLRELNVSRLYFAIRSLSSVEVHMHFSVYFASASLPLKNDLEMKVAIPYRDERYFSFHSDNPGRIKIYTKSQFGSTYLYIGKTPNPNYLSYLWYYYMSLRGESRSYIIDRPEQDTDYYFTALNYYNGNNELTIKISTESESLELGSHPVRDDTKKGDKRIYRLWMDDPSRFMVSTSLITGRTEMYLLQGEGIPSPQNHIVSSLEFPGNIVYLQNTSSIFKRGVWTVGIYAKEDSDYYISAQSNSGDLELGIPVTGKTMKSVLQFYHAEIETNQDVYVSGFTSERTCTTLYFSQTDKFPNSLTAKWRINSFAMFKHQINFAIRASQFDKNNHHLYMGVEGCENDGEMYPFEVAISQQSKFL
jgi:hypothetical protein